MNILFILGNGFDINLGLKTRYSDFYEYYQTQESKNLSITKLKENISKDLKNWADLELALGKYTLNISSLEEFDVVFEDIGEKLSEYLQQQEDLFDFSKVDLKKIYKYLAFPERTLLAADEEYINDFKNKWANSQWSVNIFTLNYTRIIERLIEEEKTPLAIGNHHQNHAIYLHKTEHIHGYLDNRMIIGVDDISQISNSSFHENQDILEAIIKSNCNQAQKHNVEKLFKNQILSSNLICIFGSSIGDTDKVWWKSVGEQLKKDCHLIIYDRCEEIPLRKGYLKARREREIKDLFLSKTNLNDEEKQKVRNKIIVAVNSLMFSNVLVV